MPAPMQGQCFEECCFRPLEYEDKAVSTLINKNLVAIDLISIFTHEALNNTHVGNILKHS